MKRDKFGVGDEACRLLNEEISGKVSAQLPGLMRRVNRKGKERTCPKRTQKLPVTQLVSGK